MGQVPAKTFPLPTSYGDSAGLNPLTQAQPQVRLPRQQFQSLASMSGITNQTNQVAQSFSNPATGYNAFYGGGSRFNPKKLMAL